MRVPDEAATRVAVVDGKRSAPRSLPAGERQHALPVGCAAEVVRSSVELAAQANAYQRRVTTAWQRRAAGAGPAPSRRAAAPAALPAGTSTPGGRAVLQGAAERGPAAGSRLGELEVRRRWGPAVIMKGVGDFPGSCCCPGTDAADVDHRRHRDEGRHLAWGRLERVDHRAVGGNRSGVSRRRLVVDGGACPVRP